jgi:hypothetical protein
MGWSGRAPAQLVARRSIIAANPNGEEGKGLIEKTGKPGTGWARARRLLCRLIPSGVQRVVGSPLGVTPEGPARDRRIQQARSILSARFVPC